MKLLHTADWHLGKTLKGQSLIYDQKFIINEIFDIIDDQKPDAILISGDIFDRSVPPPDAVDLFNDTLNRFAEKNLPTLIIAGNHDSATRLNFGSKLFAKQNIFIAAKIAENPAQIILEDNFGEIYFSLIPFFVQSEIQTKFSCEDDANKFYVDLARKNIPANKRSVALAHVFITGGIESESERKFVGGSENIDANIFANYNYVALGHLHRPQSISNAIRYAGSPLKYSFDEANHKKSVTIAEIDGAGAVKTDKIPLIPRRDVKIFKGTLAELRKKPRTQDYICAQLTEHEINIQDKLADIFPNLLKVEFLTNKPVNMDDEAREFREGGSTLDYFADFFKSQTGEDLKAEYREAMSKFLSGMWKED